MSQSTGADRQLLAPTDGKNVRWLLDTRRGDRRTDPFLVWSPPDAAACTWTYEEFVRCVDSLATALSDRGLGYGSSVCVHLDNRPEFLMALFAAHSIGAIAVTTNVKSSVAELRYFLEKSKSSVAVTEARYLETVRATGVPDRAIVLADLDDVPSEPAPEHAAASFTRLLDEAPALVFPQLDPMTPAGVQFTSGTTSRPKGVVWTHANYLWGGRVSASHERLEPDDRHLTYLPLFHTNAQIYSVMASLWVGATIILCPRFSCSTFWSSAVGHGATWASMIPFAIKALRKEPVPDHSFRMWGSSVIIPSWERYFGIPTVAWWGMTETVTHGIISDVHSPRRGGAIGGAAPEYELRLVRDAGGAESQTGLLEIRGRRGVSMALGYLDDPDAEAAAWNSDGWFATGDRVRVDADGWIEFVERDKDMLKVGGENVAASEIERVVSGVSGVNEVAVVGAPDPMYDEVPVAFVIPAPDATHDLVEKIHEACRSELASFKVPREVRLVDDFPRVTLEKVAKAQLRALLRDAPSAAD